MVLDLKTSKIYTPQTTIPILKPNGGYYFNGIHPSNGETTIILNTYFSLQFNGPNDMTRVRRGNNAYMFFTDDPISERYAPGSGIPSQLPDAVWRFDPHERSLIPVISRADLLIPNGIRVNANRTKLYVTDLSATNGFPTSQGEAGGTGSPAIFVYDLDGEAIPINKRLIGISRSDVPDGIHIDDANRIWTGEFGGMVVRNAQGKVLGLFNSEATVATPGTHLQNFALAGDTLVLLNIQRLWTLKLAQAIVNPRIGLKCDIRLRTIYQRY